MRNRFIQTGAAAAVALAAVLSLSACSTAQSKDDACTQLRNIDGSDIQTPSASEVRSGAAKDALSDVASTLENAASGISNEEVKPLVDDAATSARGVSDYYSENFANGIDTSVTDVEAAKQLQTKATEFSDKTKDFTDKLKTLRDTCGL
ncbi:MULTISPECIES: hypothetical protein [unclassified Pseudoclavibacter]|uniref:hypothetical protein n=1 Tax=unclassified Pseudoclavibacter TaxID=2615177 RepID=UPI00130192C9|nr:MULTISPECIES: hypothetical protein [unclassified Pseudoclavibacter]KAB1657554.1 hypothetical protein F8O09_07940 [Pseudoclavibacter sp. CFCC 11306]KAB1660574.1 hypothetical protein F8O07_00860 [Pseudoclavibacter sp. CFCC 13796]